MKKNRSFFRCRPSQLSPYAHATQLRFELLEERTLLTASHLHDFSREDVSVQEASPLDVATAMRLSEADSTEEILNILNLSPQPATATENSATLNASTSATDITETQDYATLLSQNALTTGILRVTTLSDTTDATDGQITLREAISYANTNNLGTTIQFDCSGTILLNGTQLIIDKSLTILGDDKISISANQQSRVLSVSEDVNLTLSGLTIKDGKVVDEGGGICNEGNLTLLGCTVKGNYVSHGNYGYAHGGGISNTGIITMVDCFVLENSVYAYAEMYKSDVYARGGGIYNIGTITMSNCAVSRNSATSDANTTYYNYDDAYGGGICNCGTITINSCIISDNSANAYDDAHGGGIHNVDTMTLVDCTVSGNFVDTGAGGGRAYGGGIHCGEFSRNDCITTIVNCVIYGNTVGGKADFASGGGINGSGVMVIFDCTVLGNSVNARWAKCGGVWGSDRTTMVNCTISGNSVNSSSSDAEGGGVVNYGTMMSMDNCSVSGNSVNSSSSDAEGGGVVNYGTMSIVSCTISGNSASIVSCTISGNSAYAYACGGGIYNGGTMSIVSCTISGNSAYADADACGGGIYNSGTMSIVSCTISGNSAIATVTNSAYGGGIYNSEHNGCEVTVINSTISGNLATARHGDNNNGYWDGTRYYYCSHDDYNIYGCCEFDFETKTWDHLAKIHQTPASDIELPEGVQLTIASLAGGGALKDQETLLLDASGSFGAAGYYWDLDGDGDFDDAVGATLTLGGPGYEATGNQISWERLKELGWTIDSARRVSVKTVAAGSSRYETDTMKSSVASVTITIGVVSFPDNNPERLAKDFVYQDTWLKGQEIDFGTGGIWTVDKVFDTSSRDGFYAVGLVKEGENPILVVRGTNNIVPAIQDLNPKGVGYAIYQTHYTELAAWLDQNANAKLVGHSLGGAICQFVAAAYTASGKRLYSVETFNSPGISSEEASRFVSANCGLVTHHVVSGDVVSLVGEAFIMGDCYLYTYSDWNPIHKHQWPVVVDFLELDRFSKPSDVTRTAISVKDLNSYWFHYNDAQFFTILAIKPSLGILFCRGGAESARQNAGTVLSQYLSLNTNEGPELGDITLTIPKIPLPNSWSLSDVSITFNPTTKVYSGSLLIDIPNGPSIGGTIGFTQYGLNKIGVAVENVNKPLGYGIMLQDAGLTLSHIGFDDMPVSLSGNIGLSYLHQIDLGELPDWLTKAVPVLKTVEGAFAKISGSFEASKEQLTIGGSVHVPYFVLGKEDYALLKTEGEIDLQWKNQKIVAKGMMKLLEILKAEATTKLTFGDTPSLEIQQTFSTTFPAPLPLLEGRVADIRTTLSLVADDNSRNDYLSMLVPVFIHGSTRQIGFRYTFDPSKSILQNLTWIGIREIIPTPHVRSLAVQNAVPLANTEGKEPYLMRLSWQTEVESPEMVLVLTDGKRVEESDFANYGLELVEDLSDDTQRVFAVSTNGDVAGWSFEMVGSTKEVVTTTWYEFVDQEPLTMTEVMSEEDGTLAITVAGEIRDDTVMRFYADTDGEGEDGVFLFEITGDQLENGTFRWRPTNIDSGEYYLYVKTLNASYYASPVTIATEVRLELSDSGVCSFGTFVENSWGTREPQRTFTITNSGTMTANISQWTLSGECVEAFHFTVLDEDGNESSLGDTVLGVGESITIRVGLNGETLTAGDKPSFTLRATTNDAQMPTLTITGSAMIVESVGSVSWEGAGGGFLEHGKSRNYSVVLDSMPEAEVKVYLSAPEGVRLEATLLTFTPENWNIPQTVTVESMGNGEDEVGTIRHTVVSSDVAFLVGGIPDVEVRVMPRNDFSLVGSIQTANHTYEKEGSWDAIPDSISRMTDWNSFYVECWTEDVSSMELGWQVVATVTYDSQLYVYDGLKNLPEGITSEQIFSEKNEEGLATVQILFTIEDVVVSQGENFFWGSLFFLPTTGTGIVGENGSVLNVTMNQQTLAMPLEPLPYDMNQDATIDIDDLIQFAKVFGKAASELSWPASEADYNRDGTVDIDDLILFAKNFGKQRGRDTQIILPEISQKMLEVSSLAEKNVLAEPAFQETVGVFPENVTSRFAVPVPMPKETDWETMVVFQGGMENTSWEGNSRGAMVVDDLAEGDEEWNFLSAEDEEEYWERLFLEMGISEKTELVLQKMP
ncbi:MAG: hypothetical protein Q4D62_08975 [Planctomycetia bacterium]|nr:hypothetical protein [Planctomycetia bacterium]